ncbi:MAG: DNA-formamidopyrimidine glycosylase family protein [Bacteroidia bacterium]
MPELPELAAFKKFIDENCLHRKIQKLKVEDRTLLKGISSQGFGRKIKGREFISSERYGKYLFLKIKNEGYVMFHFGLTGSLEFYKDTKDKPEYGKIFIYFSDKNILAYNSRRKLGYVRYIGDKKEYIKSKKLGPDALALTKGMFDKLVSDHKGVVKAFLMNQKIIAGIGNEYSDEILYQARLHPLSKIENIDHQKLFNKLNSVLNKAVEINTNGKEYPDSWLIKNRKEGDNCPDCEGIIKKAVIAGRSSYFCPECQERV